MRFTSICQYSFLQKREMYLRRGFPLCTQSTQLREVTTFLHTCLHLQYTTRSLILTCRQSVVEQEDGGIRDVQFLKTGHCGHIHRYVCGTCINIFKKTTDDLDSRDSSYCITTEMLLVTWRSGGSLFFYFIFTTGH